MTFPDTSRLQIRPLCPADFPGFSAYIQDAELCRLYGLPANLDDATIQQIFSAFCQGEKAYALIRRCDGQMAGHLLIVPPELPDPPVGQHGVTLAFAIAPAYQRQGLMHEALTAVIHHLFLQPVDYIHCGCFDFNLASARLQEQLGFHLSGTHTLSNGQIITDRLLTAPAAKDEV